MNYKELVDFDRFDIGIDDFFLLEELKPDISTVMNVLLLDGLDNKLSLFEHAVTVYYFCCRIP